MTGTEHKIVIGKESLNIKSALLDPEEKEYMISSEAPRFLEIFTVDNFRIRQGDVGMDNFILGNVSPELRPDAEKILLEIRKLI